MPSLEQLLSHLKTTQNRRAGGKVKLWNDVSARHDIITAACLGSATPTALLSGSLRACRTVAIKTSSEFTLASELYVAVWSHTDARRALISATYLKLGIDRECRAEAFRALANVALHDDNADEIWSTAKESLLAASQLASTDDLVCRAKVLGVLANLASHDNNKRRRDLWSMAKGALIAGSRDETAASREGREWALWTLAYLAFHTDIHGDIWSEASDRLSTRCCC